MIKKTYLVLKTSNSVTAAQHTKNKMKYNFKIADVLGFCLLFVGFGKSKMYYSPLLLVQFAFLLFY